MTDLLWLGASVLVVLAGAYLPAALVLRILGADRLLVLGLSPALGAAGAGIAAILAAQLGVAWSLLPHLTLFAVLAGAALVLKRLGLVLRAPATETDGSPYAPSRPLLGAVPWAPAWLVSAAAVSLVPIALAFGYPDRVLERWDTLYHLSALRRIRDTGDASSLHLGALSNTAGRPVPYPAAFHDLASLMPGAPLPVLLNAAACVLAVVPWAVGIAVLARVLFPQHRWGPFAAVIVALLAPAAPVNEWVHLSPIPNLVGFAMLPGLLASAVVLWRGAIEPDRGSGPDRDGARPQASRGARLASAVLAAVVLGMGGLGLALLQPNCAVLALLLLAAMTGGTALEHARRAPWLLLVPALLLVPVALLTWTPLGAMVTSFQGGLVVPWWQGIGEIALGLLTVWPMALGVVIALLWWPGLVSSWRPGTRWVVVAWAVVAVLYFDAAIDAVWNLSILFYRGQDRLSLPLTMLGSVLVVPGLAAWGRALGARLHDGRRPTALVGALVILAAIAAGASVPSRLDHARLNAELEHPGRARFLQADEIAAWEEVEPSMDHDAVILASPFSGASQLGAIHGQPVRFPVAGMSTSTEDRALLAAAGTAASDPASCRILREAGIGYVYQETLPYQFNSGYQQVNRADAALGTVLFETDHSRLLEVGCDDGS